MNSSGKAPFGDTFPVYNINNTSATMSLLVPCSVPSSGTSKIVIWMHKNGSNSHLPVKLNGATHVASVNDGNLYRYSFNFSFGSGTPGTNLNTAMSLTVPTSPANNSFVVAIQVPLKATYSFDFIELPPPLGSWYSGFNSTLIQKFSTSVSRFTDVFTPVRNGNEGFWLNLIVKGAMYFSWGSGLRYSIDKPYFTCCLGNPAVATLNLINATSADYYTGGCSQVVVAL